MTWDVVFFGTAPLACPSLKGLAEDPRFRVRMVVTQPDKPQGRRMELKPTPVKIEAQRLGIEVLQPAKVRAADFLDQIEALHPDIGVVAAYGQILPKRLLEIPRHGFVNVHASLLPLYRGAGPIQWAILDGQTETGVTLMEVDEGLDTGGMIRKSVTPIYDSDTAQTLHDRLADLGADLLLTTLPDYLEGRVRAVPQPEVGSSYARKIVKEDGEINWEWSARRIFNQVRGLSPWPGAHTQWTTGDGRVVPLKLWETSIEEEAIPSQPGKVLNVTREGIQVGCGQGCLRVTRLQKEGGKALTVKDFLNGNPVQPGDRFGLQT